MQFEREIQRLLIGILVLFIVITLTVSYWAIIGPETILKREDNARLFEDEARIIRGDILDRNGQILVTSVRRENSFFVDRQYLHPEMNSALGYSSLRYGVGGVEAAYNAILRGDDLPESFLERVTREFLHRPQRGSDIRLTLDLGIQRTVTQAIQGHQGAAVVMSAEDGAILALISLPTFDPNVLDVDWERLSEEPGKPFFNRVLQGNYLPGGILYTPLLSAGLAAGVPLSTIYPDGLRPVEIGGVTLHCTITPDIEDNPTLEEAYIYGCPAPFVGLAEALGVERISTATGYTPLQTQFAPSEFFQPIDVVTVATPTPDSRSLDDLLGQGSLTVAPLNLAIVTAAIVHDGNSPRPFIILDVQPQNGDPIPVQGIRSEIPVFTAERAGSLASLMRESVRRGTARAAARPGLDIGGQAATAFSGNESHTWFIGFVESGADRAYVVVIVLENSEDVDEAARIGGLALEAAYNSFSNTSNSP